MIIKFLTVALAVAVSLVVYQGMQLSSMSEKLAPQIHITKKYYALFQYFNRVTDNVKAESGIGSSWRRRLFGIEEQKEIDLSDWADPLTPIPEH